MKIAANDKPRRDLWRWARPIKRSRVVDVGWLLDTDKARFVWDDPHRVARTEPPAKHAKALSYCPATIDYQSRMIEIRCPVDLRLGFSFSEDGKPRVSNLDGDQSTIRNKQLSEMLAIIDRREWRHPDRPVLQIITPYVFIADEPVYMSQVPPTEHFKVERLPGLMVCGRLPIHIWPRHMMWAFEWFDTKAPLVLRRGEPWFYMHFEAEDPSRPFRVFETEMTPALQEYMQGARAVANYVNRTYALFKIANRRRPGVLLKRKRT